MNTIVKRLIATTLLSLMPGQLLAQTAGGASQTRGSNVGQTLLSVPANPVRTSATTAAGLPFFGPKKYVRTTGPKDVYTATVDVPPWLKGPFRLRVQNGEANGTFRVSSAIVEVNGVELLTQSDFNQNAASYEKPVTLTTPKSTLKVTLASRPTSYLTIWLYGTTNDVTAPQLTWTQPATASTINTAAPTLVVQYADAIGTGEPAASGVDRASLKVLIDDVDRSALFTRRSDEASGDIPATAPLAQGLHTYKVAIADLAGNHSEITGQFRIDLTPPTLAFTSPAAGAYLNTQAPQVKVRYQDDVALTPATLAVTVNGTPLPTASITTTATEATLALTALPEGPNQVTATIHDLGGNNATASLSFNVDITAPQVTIAQPGSAARIGSRDVPLVLTYSDEQAIVPASATAKVDATSVTLTATADGATGAMTALADGTHAITATVADRAGNIGTATSSFIVDTTVPVIKVIEPPAAANLKSAKPPVAITYADNEGVVTDSLKVTINNTDQTSLFTKTATGATGTVATTLPEGQNTIAAEIKDPTNNIGSTTSTFLVDTIVPTAQITTPAARVNTATPVVTVDYADAGSGIDPDTLTLKVDNTTTPAILAPGPDSASGALTTPLTDGSHNVQIDLADRAGNPVTATKSFVVDTKAPVLSITAPADDSFINTTTPALRAGWADPQGTGVDLASVKLTLQKRDEAATDITSYLTISPLEGVGFVPQTAALTDGTYHLTAEVRDLAGNVSSATSAFEVDTIAPAYTIETPAANGYVASRTPAFTIRWSDALSGVDLSRVVVTVDGVNRTARFITNADGATGTLLAAEALSEGAHSIQLTLYDRAGNKAPSDPQRFTVDTIVPTAAIDTPVNGSYLGKAPYALAVSYADLTGSGVDPASVRMTLDGTDRTADFTVGAASATAQLATTLTDGKHTLAVSLLDWAGNPATATSTFTVDAVPPVVTITSPQAGTWLKGSTVTVTGTVADASPVVLEINGVVASVTAGSFTAQVPATDGRFTIRATATDAAANRFTAEVVVDVDSKVPVITVTEPLNGAVTKNASIRLAGSIVDTSAVTLTLDGAALALTSNAFSTDVPLTADGVKTMTLAATDAAGNTATATVKVTRDTIAPVITVASPVKASVIGTLPVLVKGTYEDATAVTLTVDSAVATLTTSAWQASIATLSEGEHTFAIVATDAAGNTTTVSHEITIDTAAPTVVIDAPVAGSLTKEGTTTVTGTATDRTLRAVTIGGLTATLAAGTSADQKKFTVANVPLNDGDNTLTAIATDALSRTGQASVLVTRDSIAPVVTVDAPSLITRTRTTNVTATVEENLTLRDVVFTLGTTQLAKLTAPPFTTGVTAPSTAKPGDTLTLTVVATDKAGNATTVTKSLGVTSDGAVTGQVLDDSTGLPLRGARVRIAGATSEATTDERGRYALPANDQNLVLLIDFPLVGTTPMTEVERTVAIESGVGTIPVDARLTPLANPADIGQNGGFVVNATYGVNVPGGAVTTATPMRLTPLTPQGLPNLLPLGWSPVAAFDFRVDGSANNVPYEATLSGLPNASVTLVQYEPALHAWSVVSTGLVTVGGSLRATVPAPGAYALVIADDATVPAPAAGELLKGIVMQPIPDAATSSGSVNPPTLPPTGGSATGTLIVHAQPALPSGTVVQAEVTETFSLSNGEVASEETRTQDLVLYRSGNDVKAQFPIRPSRSFTSGELVEGKVHLDILAGREAVRGRTGGSQALTLDAGPVLLTVPAGALPNDLAISATPAILSSFLPSTPAAKPFAEVVLDFGGVMLATTAELSARAGDVPATETVVLARIERVRGVPKVVVVATTERVDNLYVSRPLGNLGGVRRDGRYVFYRVNVAWGLVTGALGLPSGSNPAVVQAAGFPFSAITTSQFTLIAPAGNTRLTATVPGTSLTGETTVAVPAGGSVTTTFRADAATTTAVVTPADGAVRVPTSIQLEIEATAPIRADSIDGVRLELASTGAAVAVRRVVSGSGRIVAVIPQDGLEPGTAYRLVANGVVDVYGGHIAVPAVTFTTMPNEPPQYDTTRVTFSMPDSRGMVTISAPAGSLPPGTRVVVVNDGNGVVISLTALNDGSLNGELPATINDRLLVTITDPQGNVVNFERSQFVFTDGSGRVAIGPGGGIVTGTGGTAIQLPEGALSEGAVFKVEAFGPDAFPERPADLLNAKWGGGLRVNSPQMPVLAKEGDLIFKRPADAPPGSTYWVYKRIAGPNGAVAFQLIDYALEDGKGNVVTASPPFPGWHDFVASYQIAADMVSIGLGMLSDISFVLMYQWEEMLPALPIPGAISGKVYEPEWKPGAREPEYVGVGGAVVWRRREEGRLAIPTFSISSSDGTFTVIDEQYTGGTIEMSAWKGLRYVEGTAFEANVLDSKSFFTVLFQRHRHVANVNLTLKANDQPPAAPDVEAFVFRKLDENGSKRQDIKGTMAAGYPLWAGFRVNNGVQAEIKNVTIGGDELAVGPDNASSDLPMKFVATQSYTPTMAGTFTLKASAQNPLGGAPIPVEHTFLVVANAGDGNTEAVNDKKPDWITASLVPRMDQVAVPSDALPQVVFTEPVTQVLANISLTNSDGPAPFLVSAVTIDNEKRKYVVADLSAVPPSTAVLSITIRPTGGLDLGKQYELRLLSGIQDLDTENGQPAPKNLDPKVLRFTTIGPVDTGSSSPFSAAGVVVLGSHAYVAERDSDLLNNFMTAWSLANHGNPSLVGRAGVSGQAMHIHGEESSSLTESRGPAVVVGSGLKFTVPGPSNVYLFDVNEPSQPKRVAVVSVAESAEAGVVLRVHLHGRYAYTITYPYGMQVIDMERAVEIHKEYSDDPGKRLDMAKAIVTAGVGFAQQAVVNSIDVNHIEGQFSRLFNIFAGEYVIDGQPKTLVFGTGTRPLVIIDPTSAGNSALKVVTLPGNDRGSLRNGRGLAPTLVRGRQLVIIGGDGVPQFAGSEQPTMAVVDVTNPLQPKIVGSINVPGSVADVAAHGDRAYVSTSNATYVYSIADPERPRQIGFVPGIGGSISLDANGTMVVGTSRDGVSTAGIHTAVLHPMLIVEHVDALFVSPDEAYGTPMAPQKMVLKEATKVRVKISPAGLATNAVVKFINPNFRNAEGALPPDDVITMDVTFNTEGEGEVVLPVGQRFNDTSLRAIATANTSTGGVVPSLPRDIDIGWAKLVLDANNNVELDSRDEEAKRKGRAFGFWESDPLLTPKKISFDADPSQGLSDYATARIVVNKQWWDGHPGAMRMRLHHNELPARWLVVEKVGEKRDYLRQSAVTYQQRDKIVGGPDTVYCNPTGTRFTSETSECRDLDGAIRLPKFDNGEHDFLFRCERCVTPQAGLRAIDDVPEMVLEYSANGSDGWVEIDRVRADIRPILEWITVQNVRAEGLSDRPMAKLTTPGAALRTNANEKFANDYFPGADGSPRVPARAKTVQTIVHGYLVSHKSAVYEMFPRYFKRLYWVGTPMHRLQGEWWKQDETPGCVHDCAHTVGVSWPGFNPFFPQAEFRALETGAPLAKYLAGVKAERSDRLINVVAHSLGNGVVNSAMTRPELSAPNMINRYVMNEAALPAEAMASSYSPEAGELEYYGEKHAENYGYPNDDPWVEGWAMPGAESRWIKHLNTMVEQGAPSFILNHPDWTYTRRWKQTRSMPIPETVPSEVPQRGPWRSFFWQNATKAKIFNTWSANDRILTKTWRSSNYVFKPHSKTGMLAQLAEGQARNFLLGKVIDKLKTKFGENFFKKVPDAIEKIVEEQIDFNPHLRIQDNFVLQTWALTNHTDADEDSVFGGGNHWNVKRQWAEIAFWFPATSYAAGQKNLDHVLTTGPICAVDQCNTNFTKFSPEVIDPPEWLIEGVPIPFVDISDAVRHASVGFTQYTTHTYLNTSRFHEVWEAYDQIRKMLDEKN
ncbi:MAG TPA: Ig-like domain-containing protein [Thermoanaerobaculia bacterium]|jgi:hypothetical protein